MRFRRRWHKESKKEYTPLKFFYQSAYLRQVINNELSGRLAKSFSLYLADDQYYLPSYEDASEIIKNSALDRKKWTVNKFDCDDFALVLKAHFAEAAYKDGKRRPAHCFGIAWGMFPKAHALNWMVTDDGRFLFVEPQTDEIFVPTLKHKDIWFMMA